MTTTTEQPTKTLRERFEPAIALAERLGIATGTVLVSIEPGLYFGAGAIDVVSFVREYGPPENVDTWGNARWADVMGVRVTIHDWPAERCPSCGQVRGR